MGEAWDYRRSIIIIGWNEMPGYKPVDLSGGFHNALLTSRNYKTYEYGGFEKIKNELEEKYGKVIKAVIMESTEQATNSNDIRLDYNLPVWDFSTMAKCLAAAAK